MCRKRALVRIAGPWPTGSGLPPDLQNSGNVTIVSLATGTDFRWQYERAPAMDEIALSSQSMFAELLQRCLDGEFDETFQEQGSFVRRRRDTRYYWYFRWDAGGAKHERYVGPVTDKSITDRVTRFARIKSDYKQRREMVRALLATRLPAPDAMAGSVVEAMWKAGFFRLRGVLVGSLAYPCYAGPLGIRLTAASVRTDDADFAQFWGVSENIGENMEHPLTVLRTVDPSFREVPDLSDPFVTSRYSTKTGYKVEFLTPNRGSDDHTGKAAKMKALAGAGAQPLRHLESLIHQPERSVMLFGGGVPVTLPRAERYAVHKIIVAVERRDQVKAQKDIVQAGTLITATAKRRPLELGEAWLEAWNVGPRWREKLDAGRERLSDGERNELKRVVELAKGAGERRSARKARRRDRDPS